MGPEKRAPREQPIISHAHYGPPINSVEGAQRMICCSNRRKCLTKAVLLDECLFPWRDWSVLRALQYKWK